MKRLLLFDIDGTLIDTEGAGLAALEDGLYEAFPGREHISFPPLDLGGATDGSVIAFLFRHFTIEDHPENHRLFHGAYTGALRSRLETFRGEGRGRILPGVRRLVEHLAEERDFALGLLTGNMEAGARIKLDHFDLGRHFAFGAFGDDHHDRNLLGPIAVERAFQCTGATFASGDTVIIGDTIKDIACARAFGARVVGVATGSSSGQTLASGDPDALLQDLSDLPAVLEAIESVFLS